MRLTTHAAFRVDILCLPQDAVNVLRYISGQKRRKVTCRDQRPHILVEYMQFTAKDDSLVSESALLRLRLKLTLPIVLDQDCGTLKVSGYVRGRALSVNGLVHLPGAGDFQMEQVESSLFVFAVLNLPQDIC